MIFIKLQNTYKVHIGKTLFTTFYASRPALLKYNAHCAELDVT